MFFRKVIIQAFITAAILSTAFAQTASLPNIVVFLADDHGFLDSEVYGSKTARTPNMLRLAHDGIALTRAFVASPSCAPSRAALLTGLMPARNGAEPNHSKPRPEIKKLPAYLQELGYEVVAFGKVSHYQHTADYGFNYFAHDKFHEDVAVSAALKWLEERKSQKPLCLFVGSNWPHVPWPDIPETAKTARESLPAKHIPTEQTLHARAAYFAAVEKMDSELGQVYDLSRRVFGTNLFFLHSSDHGAQFPFGKWNCYDTGIRTSFLAVWPGMIQPGSRNDAMVSWIDILPTLVEAAHGLAPKGIDGASFLEVLRGRKTNHRDVIYTVHSADGNMNVYPIRSLRTADFKYIQNLHPEFKYTTHIDRAPRNPNRPVAWGDYWKSWVEEAKTNPVAARIVQQYRQRPAEELYDLRNDPNEERNLAADPSQADRLKQFRTRLDSWLTEQGDKRTVFGEPLLLETK